MNLIPWMRRESSRLPALPRSLWGGEMDRLLERMLSNFWHSAEGDFVPERAWTPSVEVSETETEVIVRAEIPGVDPKHVEVTVEGDRLLIAGEKEESKEKTEKNYHVSERSYGSFRRSIELPASIQADSAAAEHKDGVLTVTLKKDPKLTPKKIHVKVS